MKAGKMKKIAVIVLLAMQLFAQSNPGMEMQDAIKKEQVDGDLKAAIAIYQSVAADANAPRDLRAKALLHLGRCYEKLGQQAQTVYRQIVRDFGDQPEAAQAKARLAVLQEADRPAAPATITQRKIQMPDPQMLPEDTDGRRAVYLNETTGEVIYGDVAGKTKRVIFRKRPGDHYGGFWPSRDFSMAAIKFHLPDKKEIFSVVKTDGTGYREVANLEGEHFVCSWSWDNRYILLSGHSQDGSFGLLRISVANGQIRELLNVKTGIAWGAKFSPDGRFVAYQASPTFAFDGVARLFVMSAEGGEPQMVYQERHGSEVSKTYESVRLLDWTADGRYLAIASERTGKGALHLLPIRDGKPAGGPVFVKYGDFVSGVTTATGGLVYQSTKPGGVWSVYLAPLDANGRPAGWKRLDLPLGNTLNPGLKFSDDGNQIVYVAMNSDAGQAGGRVVHLRNLATGEDREVYHAAGSISCVWAVQQPKLFCIDAAEKTEMFSIGIDSGEIARLHTFPARRLLMIDHLGRDGRVLYMLDLLSDGGMAIAQLEMATGQETILGQVPFKLDSDDSGSVGFPDDRWLVRHVKQRFEIRSTAGGDWKPLVSLVSPKLPADSLSPDGNWLLYTDVDPAGTRSLFRIPTAGGTPERLSDFPTHNGEGSIEISPDGSKIIISAGEFETGFELWSLENFVPLAPKR